MKEEKDHSIHPGLHVAFSFENFSREEKEIINKLSQYWYITNQGFRVEVGHSNYSFFLMKPTQEYTELFNLKRELVVIFSDYENFEPRNLDPFKKAIDMFPDLRIDKISCILISKDDSIEDKINDLIRNEAESPIVVPFSYFELLADYDSGFLKNRFRSKFYERDLFSFQSALQKDTYFFGRTDIIQKIISRHENNENSGLFGLRKTGKTSIIYGVQRVISRKEMLSIYLDAKIHQFTKENGTNCFFGSQVSFLRH